MLLKYHSHHNSDAKTEHFQIEVWKIVLHYLTVPAEGNAYI